MDALDTIDSSSIRVDQETKKGSVMDTIRMVLGCNSGAANTYINRLFVTSPELTTQIGQLRINNKGRETPSPTPKH